MICNYEITAKQNAPSNRRQGEMVEIEGFVLKLGENPDGVRHISESRYRS